MTLAYVSNGGIVGSASSGGNFSTNAAYPAIVTAGNFLLLHSFARTTGARAIDTLPVPAGFTSINISTVSVLSVIRAAYKIANGSEGGGTVNVTGTVSGATPHTHGTLISQFSGNAVTGTIVESGGTVDDQTGFSIAPSPASATSGIADCLAICGITIGFATTCSDIVGEMGGDYTELFAELTTGNLVIDVQSAALVAAGTISGGVATLGGASNWATSSFILRPLPPAVGANNSRRNFPQLNR